MKQTGFRVRCIYKKDLALRLSLDCLATSYSTGRSVLKEADGQFRVPSALVSLTSVFGIYKHALTWHVYAGNLAQERLGACVASGFP